MHRPEHRDTMIRVLRTVQSAKQAVRFTPLKTLVCIFAIRFTRDFTEEGLRRNRESFNTLLTSCKNRKYQTALQIYFLSSFKLPRELREL